MGSCVFYPHCRNLKGEVVESKLFRDLYNYTSDRKLANEYYGIGTNQEFLNKVSEEAEFDENGEITLESLSKLTGLKLSEERALKVLNKEIKAGKYSWEEAIAKVQLFNKSHQFKNQYLATVTQVGDGKYELSVVKRTKHNEDKLNREVANRNLLDRLIYRLSQLNVGVEFLQDGNFFGRYSTKNALRSAEGLYQLIQLVEGKATTETLAEEAGHFAIGALGKSPLVSRLLKLLTPEVQKLILGEDYKSKDLGSNPAREVAGVLVGRALNGLVDKRGPWQSLVSKIVNLAKRIFSQLTGDRVTRDMLTAQAIADKIAQGFMSSSFVGDVDTALLTEEELFDAEESVNVSTFREVVTILKLLLASMKEINPAEAAKYKALLDLVESSRKIEGNNAYADQLAIESITEAIVLLADKLSAEVPELLNSVNFEDRADFNTNMTRNAKNLRTVRVYMLTTAALIDTIRKVSGKVSSPNRLTITENVHIMDKWGGFQVVSLLDTIDKLEHSLRGREGMLAVLADKERQLYLKFLESSYGNNYIHRAARVIFRVKELAKNSKVWVRTGMVSWKRIDSGTKKKSRTLFVDSVEAENIPLSKYLSHMQDDLTMFERFLASMSNSSDVIHQISDKVAKEANKRADDLTNLDWDALRSLEARLKALGIKRPDIMYERSAVDGSITGNVVSELNRGDWENAYYKFKLKAKEDFKEEHPDADKLTDFQRSVIWGAWYRNKVKREFHDIHSTWNKELNMYEPNSDSDVNGDPNKVSYTNPQYLEIQNNPELALWLKDYLELKKSIDARLPEGSMPWYRLPQFKGTFSNKVRNRKITSTTSKSVLSTLRKTIRDIFCEDCDDTEFGSDQTYDTIEDDNFNDSFNVEMEKIHRVPLYGINKMKDMTQLSTDLFHSTLAYSSMANTHAALESIVDVMEIGSTVMMDRRIKGTKETDKNKLGYTSRSYARYLKFLDKQIYLIGQPKIKVTRKIVLNKVANALNSASRAIFLGGNVPGGMVNLGTGSIEIFKEAATGQYFNLEDWRKAHAIYWKSLPKNIAAVGSSLKQDEVSLFMRHFNVLNDSKGKHRKWHTNDSWIVNALEDSLYLPYKTGDHYMQCISYLSLANHIKVFNSSGEEMSLFDAYSKKDLGKATTKDGKSKDIGYTYGLSDVVFKTREDIEKYTDLKDIISAIEEYHREKVSNPVTASLDLTDAQKEILALTEYSLDEIMENPKTIKALYDVLELYTWNASDETDFINKAREINIRMHGIYNSYDGVAFLLSIYGQLLLSMRLYALGLLERRISGSKTSIMLGGESEGSLTTLAKVALACRTDNSPGALSTFRAIVMPFFEKDKEALRKAGFSDTLIYNLKRNWYDGLFITALWILSAMTAGGEDDDDVLLGLSHYFFTRWAREQSAFNTIYGVREEGPSVFNLCPSALSGLIYMGETVDLLVGAYLTNPREESGKDYYYQRSKKGRYDKYDPKYEYKILSKTPYYRAYYLPQNPYESTKSYKYGLSVNN